MKDLIRLESLWKVYDLGVTQVAALRGMDLRIGQGEYIAIMGPSGSGKSTMLNLLGCLDRPSHGSYWLGDEDVSGMNDDQLSEVRNRRIGFVFQSFNLIQQLSIVENIEVPLFYQGIPRGRRHPRSRDLASLVGLGDRLGHRPSELSGGQQQRVAIARALANDPLIILADEPTGNLDSASGSDILTILDRLHEEGKTLIVVTHDENIATRAQRVVRLFDGCIAKDEFNKR